MPHLRPFRPGDEPALAEICLRTADTGADGAGILTDDDLWDWQRMADALAATDP